MSCNNSLNGSQHNQQQSPGRPDCVDALIVLTIDSLSPFLIVSQGCSPRLFIACSLQVAEEEAENMEASPEEEEAEDESMDAAGDSLPSLGKRRSTDTALSGQTSSKRSRPGSLAEVAFAM